jgi:hypothetical protein
MRGYYDDDPPTVGDCQDIARCSRLTTRKLIADAVAKGLLEVRPAADDHRKRIVCPTERTVMEYMSMVRGYVDFCGQVRFSSGADWRGAACVGETPASTRVPSAAQPRRSA